jgi:hypothetical protein
MSGMEDSQNVQESVARAEELIDMPGIRYYVRGRHSIDSSVNNLTF